ncbi:MAG: uracil-DNA glycosylase [Chloroflexi bacterium]|nr:uracil-DNA glycosylase [Chloroflexota bacterium]
MNAASSSISADHLTALNKRLALCRLCPRLVAHREEAGVAKRPAYRDWDYWSRPVPGFGDPRAKVVAIGLAPAAHGGNRTGRMFTGDASARFLMPALYQAGFASQPTSEQRDDGLALRGLYLTAAARCAPPKDRPTPSELASCAPYLQEEMELLTEARVVLALGRIAFEAYLRVASGWLGKPLRLPFQHGVRYEMPAGPQALYACYHPSPRNHQTGRLSQEGLLEVLARVRSEIA